MTQNNKSQNSEGLARDIAPEFETELESSSSQHPQELRKRRREVIGILVLSVVFVFLIWLEIRMFSLSQSLPLEHSIFFFGLVNFNIIVLLLLLFFIFRNIVKVYLERQSSVFGSSLKAKLVAAFVAFSSIPTILMFIISVFYINSSFEKWFSLKVAAVLKNSTEVTNSYIFNTKKKNYHFAYSIADSISSMSQNKDIKNRLVNLRKVYAIDSLEYYPSLFGKRIVVTDDIDVLKEVPTVSLDFLQKPIKAQTEASTVHQFGEGNLIRVTVPVAEGSKGAIVVSSFVPLSLLSKMNDVSTAYGEFRDMNPLQYSLKSIYLILLIMMTLVILVAATWLGFYLARQISIPLVQLGRATKRVVKGDYQPIQVNTGSEELASLVDNFNQMTSELETTYKNLDQHSRYIEVVLRSVSAGVISVDRSGVITTINRHAQELLHLDPLDYVGKSVVDCKDTEFFKSVEQMIAQLSLHRLESLQKETQMNVNAEVLPLQLTLSQMRDDKGQNIGQILVFDDLTPIVNAQRSAAWTEVARRIAHEIKNPLTPIRISAERLQRKFGESITDPAFKECTTMIVRQVDEMKSLVNEFSQFARMPQSKPVVGSIKKVIEDALSVFRTSHPHVHFVLDLDPNVPDFKFDPEQMRRVLVNLIDNGIAATLKEAKPEVGVSTRYQKGVEILTMTVFDNGAGIPVSQRTRVFEPYYSTKESGTGLGLPIVKRIVEDHNGLIRAMANDPRGTKMLIEIPVYSAV